jgi:putative CocE/NonD family hydrolase
MKLFLLLFLVVPTVVLAQEPDSAWFVSHYTKEEKYIGMRDGIKLFTSIYIPNDKSEKHPILITRTPYSCSPYGAGKYRGFWGGHYREYLQENYIMVMQDVRGKYMSEGKFVDVRPFIFDKKDKSQIDEASDTYDTVDWLVKNLENNNGNVGVVGISYPGFYATEAALSGHPAIKAVSPQAPVTDWFVGDDWHHKGALMLMDAFGFYVSGGFGMPRPGPITEITSEGFQSPTKDSYDFFLRTGALSNLTKLAGDSVEFWREIMEHPNYDDWWQKRNARSGIKNNVKPAMLVVGGLFDAEDCFGAWNTYKAIEKNSRGTNNKLVMGPWYHGQWSSKDGSHLGNVQFGSNTSEWYAENMEVPFFNYYLKGKGSVDDIGEANIFFTGANEWRKLDSWPAKGVTSRPLYFGPLGALAWKKSSAAGGFTEYVSDPAKPVPYSDGVISNRTREYMTDDQRFASYRPDVLVFKTDTLTEDVTVAGELSADLNVSITGTDADFVVKLIDVFPDNFEYSDDDKYIMNGYEMLVRGEVMRGRFRNSFEKPEAFVPGKVTEVKFKLPDVAHVFKKGHRIMVQVQSSWFPLVDRNPQNFVDIYHAKDKDFRKISVRVYHDAAHASSIVLPVVRGER